MRLCTVANSSLFLYFVCFIAEYRIKKSLHTYRETYPCIGKFCSNSTIYIIRVNSHLKYFLDIFLAQLNKIRTPIVY